MESRIHGFAVSAHPNRPVPDVGSSQKVVEILGVPVARIGMAEALVAVGKMMDSGQPHQVATVNTHFLRVASCSSNLRQILQRADLVLCDSTPLLWAARFLGGVIPERVAGSDLVPRLLQSAACSGKSVFWLGGTPSDSEAVRNKIQEQLPGLRFHAWAVPKFPPDSKAMEHARDIVARANPDLLLVSWGCPIAEVWISKYARNLGVPVAVGVGAAAAFFAGRLPRAPLFLQRVGLEWAFRLLQEPRRLALRYLRDALTVPVAILAQRLGLRCPPSR